MFVQIDSFGILKTYNEFDMRSQTFSYFLLSSHSSKLKYDSYLKQNYQFQLQCVNVNREKSSRENWEEKSFDFVRTFIGRDERIKVRRVYMHEAILCSTLLCSFLTMLERTKWEEDEERVHGSSNTFSFIWLCILQNSWNFIYFQKGNIHS